METEIMVAGSIDGSFSLTRRGIVLRLPLPECWVVRKKYIEASKARIYHSGDDSVALVAQTVLLYVFENILKLLHTFMPFVTEELWQI
nr:unnamed protein product [Gossypium raimondii]